MSKIENLKKYKGFRIGDWVEQIGPINKGDSRLCKIIAFEGRKQEFTERRVRRIVVVHRHLNKDRYNRIGMINIRSSTLSFKKIPKLKRLLKYGI